MNKNSAVRISEKLEILFDSISDKERLALIRLIKHRLRNPQSYVTIIGETSTGKSSLINSLFQRQLLPVSAPPTTAIVTHVACLDIAEDKYFAIYRDATQDAISRGKFVSLSVSPNEERDLLRLQVRAKPVETHFYGLNIFDTPGYNSLLAEHEEVLRSFLPQSDVIIFVVTYRTGFGSTDKEQTQDLLDVVFSSTEHVDEIPIILVVNKSPAAVDENDNRLREILSNVHDSIHNIPKLVLVDHASAPENGDQSENSAEHPIPNANELWKEVAGIVEKPEMQIRVKEKLITMMIDLIDDADAAAEREEITLSASTEELKTIEEQIRALQKARDESLKEIEKTIKRLELLLPKLINHLALEMYKKAACEIEKSDKWLDLGEFCAQWITAHVLPYEVRLAAKSVEDMIAREMEALNKRLEDLANTAIKKVNDLVKVKNDITARFAQNIAKVLLQRIGGNALQNVLRGLGGIGGTAAGAGNLVKMAVSRLGKVFGQTFSRQVYTNIGKTFTKQFLKRLNVAIQIVVDTIIYIRQAQTWQRKLKEKVEEAINNWKDGDEEDIGVIDDLIKNQLPDIKKNNDSDVCSFYDDLINNESISRDERQSNTEQDLASIQRIRSEFKQLRQQLVSLKK